MVSKKLFLILFLVISINFILANCEEGQIDINTASAEELDEIIWVGPVTAENIISERPFDSVDDLIRVYGIGEIKLQDIKDQGLACVEDSESSGSSESSSEPEEEEEEDDEPEVIYISQNNTQESNQEKQNKILDTINLNTGKNTQGLTKSDYALYGLVIFAVVIIILFLLRKNKYKNEFR